MARLSDIRANMPKKQRQKVVESVVNDVGGTHQKPKEPKILPHTPSYNVDEIWASFGKHRELRPALEEAEA